MASIEKVTLESATVHTAATNGTSKSLGVGQKSFIFWVSVTAFTGTNVTITLQHSADGVTFFDVGAPAAFTTTGQKILDQASFTVAFASLLPTVRIRSSGTWTTATFDAGLFSDPK